MVTAEGHWVSRGVSSCRACVGRCGRCFACSNFLISLRTQCAYIPAIYVCTHTHIHVCVVERLENFGSCSLFLRFFGFSVYLNLRSRKRRGTYFNCSPFGHEVQQLSAKLAIVIVFFISLSLLLSGSAFSV